MHKFGNVKVIVQRPMAVLVRAEDSTTVESGAEAWIPHSQIHDDSEVYDETAEGEEGQLVVSDWKAQQEGWV